MSTTENSLVSALTQPPSGFHAPTPTQGIKSLQPSWHWVKLLLSTHYITWLLANRLVMDHVKWAISVYVIPSGAIFQSNASVFFAAEMRRGWFEVDYSSECLSCDGLVMCSGSQVSICLVSLHMQWKKICKECSNRSECLQGWTKGPADPEQASMLIWPVMLSAGTLPPRVNDCEGL